MKRSVFGALLTFLPAVLSLAAQHEATIPQNTDIFVTLGAGFSSKTARIGDRFFAIVAVPVVVDDQIVIPQGSKLLGQVSEIRKGARKKAEGWIGLAIESVVLPSGASRNLEADLSEVEGEVPEKDEGKEVDIPHTVTSVAMLGADKLIELFEGKPEELPRGASITIQTRSPLRLVPPASP